MNILAALGLTFIITDSRIFMPLRNWLSLKAKKHKWLKWVDIVINCPQCFGLWAGLLIALVLNGNLVEVALGTSFLAFIVNKCLFVLK